MQTSTKSKKPASSADSSILGKVPPHDVEAEQAVLGSMLLSEEAIVKAGEILEGADFYRLRHQLIFETIMALNDSGEPADTVTLVASLRSAGKLDDIGGSDYLEDLYNIIPTPGNVEHYANIVRQKSLLRQLIGASHRIQGACYEGNEDIEALLDEAEKTIFGLTQSRQTKPYHHMKDVMSETFPLIEQLYNRKESITGIPSGLKDLDRITTGFQKSDLVILAARPSMGKTALSLGFLLYAALVHRVPVLFFSLEMSRTQLAMRMLSMESKIDGQSLRRGFFKEDQWGILTSSASVLSQAPIYIDDTPGLTIRAMRSKARRLTAEAEIGLVAVDYLQLMEAPGSQESRQNEISTISRSLKGLARELRVPVLALSQLSRKVEERTDKRPILSDLRESGAIEQDADLVMFIYREDRYKTRPGEEPTNEAEIIVAKQRNGPLGTVSCTFLDKYSRFVDRAHEEY